MGSALLAEMVKSAASELPQLTLTELHACRRHRPATPLSSPRGGPARLPTGKQAPALLQLLGRGSYGVGGGVKTNFWGGSVSQLPPRKKTASHLGDSTLQTPTPCWRDFEN